MAIMTEKKIAGEPFSQFLKGIKINSLKSEIERLSKPKFENGKDEKGLVRSIIVPVYDGVNLEHEILGDSYKEGEDFVTLYGYKLDLAKMTMPEDKANQYGNEFNTALDKSYIEFSKQIGFDSFSKFIDGMNAPTRAADAAAEPEPEVEAGLGD